METHKQTNGGGADLPVEIDRIASDLRDAERQEPVRDVVRTFERWDQGIQQSIQRIQRIVDGQEERVVKAAQAEAAVAGLAREVARLQALEGTVNDLVASAAGLRHDIAGLDAKLAATRRGQHVMAWLIVLLAIAVCGIILHATGHWPTLMRWLHLPR